MDNGCCFVREGGVQAKRIQFVRLVVEPLSPLFPATCATGRGVILAAAAPNGDVAVQYPIAVCTSLLTKIKIDFAFCARQVLRKALMHDMQASFSVG